jgi:hypothetical protein
MLLPCEHEDPPLSGFKYLHKKGDIIYSAEIWRLGEAEDAVADEVKGVKIKEVANLKLLVEGSISWRRIQLCLHAASHAVHDL